jgi:hypothetical protein
MRLQTEQRHQEIDEIVVENLQVHAIELQMKRQPPDVAVMIRYCLMKGYGGSECKLVISFRRSSTLWLMLNVIAMYASVDRIALLPVLILINVLSTWHVLDVFDVFP